MAEEARGRLSAVAIFAVNGKPVRAEQPGRLLDFLRGPLELTGPRGECGDASCGACTVMVDGVARLACQVEVEHLTGVSVATVEGLRGLNTLSRLQLAFLKHDVVGCGYCLPGLLAAATASLGATHDCTREELRTALAGVACACLDRERILDAVAAAKAEHIQLDLAAADAEAVAKVTGERYVTAPSQA